MPRRRRTLKCCSAISTRRTYIWSGLAYVAVVAWLYLANEGQTCFAVCPSKLFYGLPCPGCGTTRATLQLLHGNLLAALRLNPNCLLAAAFLLFYPLLLLLSLVRRRHYLPLLVEEGKRWMGGWIFWVLFGIIEGGIWWHNFLVL